MPTPITTNNITPNTNAILSTTLYTCNRPVWVSYKYSSAVGTEIPRAVEITVWGNKDGDWLPLGANLYKNKDSDSNAAAPTFTFDISGILKANLSKNFHHDILDEAYDSPISLANDGTNANYNGMIAVDVKAKCHYEVGGIMTPSADTATPISYPSSTGIYIVPSDLSLSDNIPSSGWPITNLPTSTKTSWLWDSSTSADISGKTPATMCPNNLVRKIPLGYPLIMGMIFNDTAMSSCQWKLNYTHSTGSSIVDLDNVPTIGTAFDTYIWNYKVDAIVGGTSLLANATHTWPQIRPEFSIYLESNTSSRTEAYKFEMIGSSASNSSIPPMKPNTECVYWLNDLGFLDFYYFNGGSEIETESEKVNYVRGNKDFSDISKLRFGVSSAKTIVKKTLYTEAVNHDAIVWLTEILRSTEVFIYDPVERQLRSVEVVDGIANPLAFGGGNAQFSFTYIDNILVQKG